MVNNNFLITSLNSFFLKFDPVFITLWQKRKNILITNTAATVIFAALIFFVLTPYYDVSVTILPDYGNKPGVSLGGLGGLASIAGLGNLAGENLPQIYDNLLISESVLKNVIYKKYLTEKYPDSVNLIKYFKIKSTVAPNQELEERERFVKMVRTFVKSIIDTKIDRISQVMTITVRTEEPKLSTEIVNTLVVELEKYIRTQKKSYAAEQRAYVEKRIDQVQDSLELAEIAIKNFREANSIYNQSPKLLMEQTRLMRNIQILDVVYTELHKQLELIKIEEIKDVSILNVKEYAQNPVLRTGPHRTIDLIIVMFFVSIFSLFYFYYEEIIKETFQLLRHKFSNLRKVQNSV
jgi:uncharacterized protein involved in exopolysaccharide biosynthesis